MIAHSHGGVDSDGTYVFLSEGDDEGVGYDFMKSQNLQFQNIKTLAKAINKLSGDVVAFRKTVVLHAYSKMHRELQKSPSQNSDQDPPESTPEAQPNPPPSSQE